MSAADVLKSYVGGLKAALDSIPQKDFETAVAMIEMAWRNGSTIFACGNGGSAATASHLACDFSKTTLGKLGNAQMKRIKCVALTDNVPLVTAWSNDASYDSIFAEQLRNLASKGDLLIAISASGNSPNVLEALRAAKPLGVQSLCFLGFGGGKAKSESNHSIVIDSSDYGIVEDAHAALMHVFTMHMRTLVSKG